ncbi:hypothetical protein A4A49_24365 [Nicotiana attenuata]|uniref:Uncharacterized protein n=1 Tax=Nicotiana attenuata TaxID=49451 RepID=A0A1J6K977_NICAT|nr:hypothetical protein A4A49_24365 [Nicotiana attenuata]
MKRRKNRYQRDKNGKIIEEANDKNDDKLKGKAKEDVVTTKNSFEILENHESDKTILRITDGKGEGIQKLQELKRVKQEAVEKVLEKEGTGNPTPIGILLPATKGDQELAKASSTNPVEKRIDENARKESTIEWVHRRKALWSDEIEGMEAQLDTKTTVVHKEKEDSNQPQETGSVKAAIVNPNPNCQEIRVEDKSSSKVNQSGLSIGDDRGASKEAGKLGSSAQLSVTKKRCNGTVNPSKSRESLALVDGVSGYDLEKGLDEDVHMKTATVLPGLGNVYELQFKMMQAALSSMEQNKVNEELNEHTKEKFEQAIVPRSSGEVKVVPMACESGPEHIMQLQLSLPLKTHLQHLHDLVTYNVAPIE